MESVLRGGASWGGSGGCGAEFLGLVIGLSKSCFLEREFGFRASFASFLLSGERLAMFVIEASFGFFRVGFGAPFFSVGESIKRFFI